MNPAEPPQAQCTLRCIGCDNETVVPLDSVRGLDTPPMCEKYYMPCTMVSVSLEN